MKFSKLPTKKDFFFRKEELAYIRSLAASSEPKILAVYGRRRVGKSELIAQALCDFNVLKIEGLQGLKLKDQLNRSMKQLASGLEDLDLARIQLDSWYDFFDILLRKIDFSQPLVLYFEEVQWLAGYSHEFVSDLKYFWDNHLQYESKFFLVLCGSSPSFMIDQVINSSALYNRSLYQLHLQPFSLQEARGFMGSQYTDLQLTDAFLTVGGIPEYLKYLQEDSSILLGICKNSFKKDSFFSTEYQRIFISSLKDNPNYRKIIAILARRRFASREQILDGLGRKSGGDISELLEELELSGFIESYRPYYNPSSKNLVRFQISDPYLQFYFKFIEPLGRNITARIYNKDPLKALNLSQYQTWLGYQYERWCRSNHSLLAKLMGFESVRYNHGALFSRNLDKIKAGFQWDLAFQRKDKVLTLCEIKYLKTPVDTTVAKEFQSKLDLFPEKFTKGYTLEKVLIAPLGASDSLRDLGFFDRVIDLEKILAAYQFGYA